MKNLVSKILYSVRSSDMNYSMFSSSFTSPFIPSSLVPPKKKLLRQNCSCSWLGGQLKMQTLKEDLNSQNLGPGEFLSTFLAIHRFKAVFLSCLPACIQNRTFYSKERGVAYRFQALHIDFNRTIWLLYRDPLLSNQNSMQRMEILILHSTRNKSGWSWSIMISSIIER